MSYQRHRRFRKLFRQVVFYLAVMLVSIPLLFVFYWMLATSLKSPNETFVYPPLFIFTPTLYNYKTVIVRSPFLQYLLNSLKVSTGATLIGLILGLPAAYGVARFKRMGLVMPILVARIAPGMAYLVPWFIVLRMMHLIDTILGLTITHIILTLPIILWLMISFFEDLPREVEDAALVDGCNWFGVFWRVALPVTRPAVFASSVLAFIESWNHLSFALVLTSERARTLPVAIFTFVARQNVEWGSVAASGVLIVLPVFILTLLVQRYIISGLTFGAVK
jgi:multiple sugar transport system permease protein